MKLKEALKEEKPGMFKDLQLGRIYRKSQKNTKWSESFIWYLLAAVDSLHQDKKSLVLGAAKNADSGEKDVPSYYSKDSQD